MDTMQGTDKLLTEKETAALLGISVKTLQKWRYLRIGVPFIRIGRLIRYKVESITDYLTNNEVKMR